MSERDELLSTIRATRHIRALHLETAADIIEHVTRGVADAILAAGYRRPWTVTTVAELAALPVGSVVLHNGRAFQHYPAHPAPFDEYQQWKCADGGFVRSTKDGSSILPATVLHEPEATK